MKAKSIVISEPLSEAVITAYFKTGYDSDRVRYRVVDGLPQDAKLIDIKWFRDNGGAIAFVFESASFPDVEDPTQEIITIRTEPKVCE